MCARELAAHRDRRRSKLLYVWQMQIQVGEIVVVLITTTAAVIAAAHVGCVSGEAVTDRSIELP